MNKIWGVFVLSLISLGVWAQDLNFSLGSQPIPKALQSSLDGATVVPGSETKTMVDLSPLFPPPGYQGDQNSCVAWAVAYGTKTYQENLERGWGFDTPEKIFSPAFIYNQINGGRDAGSNLAKAVDLVKNMGAATLKTMPYNPGDYTSQPSQTALAEARQYPASTYEVVDPKNTLAIKTLLSSKDPVIFGMKIYENFLTYKSGVYKNVSGAELGGHAMVVVGFDDSKKAFKILNSWSDKWGEGGYAWVDYQVFANNVHTAVVMKDAQEAKPNVVSAPTGIQASQGAYLDKIEIVWNPMPGAESYLVFRAETPQGPFSLRGEVKGAMFIDNDTKAEKFYYYTIKTKGPAGASEASPLAQGFLQAPQGIGIPNGLMAERSPQGVRLIWSPVANNTGYQIYRFNDGNENFQLIGSSKDPGFEDRSLGTKPGSYWYLVTALAKEKESPASEPVSITIPAREVKFLRSPKNVRASQGTFSNKVEITWSPVTGAQSYDVMKYNRQTKDWALYKTVVAEKFIDTTPGTGIQYYGITARAGTVRSTTEDYILGFTSSNTPKPRRRYADESYFSASDRTAAFEKEDLFKSDEFFSDSKTFFNNFVPKDFFMVDTEKFFRVNPDFFKVDENFFTDESDFFR